MKNGITAARTGALGDAAVIVAAGTPKNGTKTLSLPRMSWSGAYQIVPPVRAVATVPQVFLDEHR
jgi:hypothetical protein